MHLLELLVAERPGQIAAKNLRADAGRRVAHFDGLVVHGNASRVAQRTADRRQRKDTEDRNLRLRLSSILCPLSSDQATPARSRSWKCTMPTGLPASATRSAVIFDELMISKASLAS